MKTVRSFIERHPVTTYFALTFAVSWGGVLLVVGGPGGIPASPEQAERLLPLVILAMEAGPPVTALLLTGLVSGRAGFRGLLSRLLRWRVGARWWAVALLAAPLLLGASLFALSFLSPAFLPAVVTTDDKTSLLLLALVGGLVGGFLEELGWTGFAVPTLRQRHGVLATGLAVGAMWGAWHFLVNLWGSTNPAGELSLAIFLPALVVLLFVGVLPAYRMLMVWVYDRTESLLVAMLMHASLIAFYAVSLVPPATGVAFLIWESVFAAALWVFVAAVAVANGWHLSRRPLRGRAA